MSSYQEHWELCIQSSAPILTFFLHSSLHCYKNIYKLSIIRLKKKKRFKVQGVASFKVPRTAQFMQALGVSFCIVITKIFFDTFLIAKKNKSKCRSQILLGFLVLRIKEMWKLASRSVVSNYTKLKMPFFHVIGFPLPSSGVLHFAKAPSPQPPLHGFILFSGWIQGAFCRKKKFKKQQLGVAAAICSSKQTQEGRLWLTRTLHLPDT